MTRPRAALSRQDLPKLLGILKASGAREATFFPDGRLATVKIGVEEKQEPAGKPEPAAESPWAEHKRALRVLHGGTQDLDGEDLS